MVSVAMTTYNGVKYIREQLESLRRQTRPADEIVIVDDGSKDGTVEAVQIYATEHPECHIRLVQNEENLGYKRNFRKAISLCSGDVIFLCDQDDRWLNCKIELMCDMLQRNPDIGVLSTSFFLMDSQSRRGKKRSAYPRKIKEEALFCVPVEDLIFHNISQGCAMAMTRDIKECFLEQFDDTISHDWLINVIAGMKKKCYYWNVPMFCYRIHEQNTIGLNDNMALQQKNTLEVRSKDAQQALQILSFIERTDVQYFSEHAWLGGAKQFAEKHIEYLKGYDFLGLFVQNFNSYYGTLKTIRGRMLDLFFVLKKS